MTTITVGDVIFPGKLIAHATAKGDVIVNATNPINEILYATLSIKDACEFTRMMLNAVEQAVAEMARIKSM